MMCILDDSGLGRDIFQVYWPYLVMSFGTTGKVTSKQETTLLLYLARHFAAAGNVEINVGNIVRWLYFALSL